MRVEAFRGFRDRREFDLSASAVIVTGPNGTGKTSFFDALQWCLLGTIQRLEDLRARRTVEHIVNQYRISGRAVVEIDMVVNARAFTIRRTGNHTGNTLEFNESGAATRFGDEAEAALGEALAPGSDFTLEMALTTSGLMQQDVMRAVLEAKPADRYRHLSTVLGLGGLEDFEEATRELSREAANRADFARSERDAATTALVAARERLASSQQRLDTLPQLETLRLEILALLQNGPAAVTTEIPEASLSSIEACQSVLSTLASTIDQIEDLSSRWSKAENLKAALGVEPIEDQFASHVAAREAARSEIAERRTLLQAADAQFSSAQSASEDLARLAALVIPMLAHACPVCGQEIDPAHVEAELRDRAASTDTMLALRAEIDARRAALQSAEAAALDAEAALAELGRQRAEWSAYARAEAEASHSFARLISSTSSEIRLGSERPEDLARSAGPILEHLRNVRRRLLEYLNALEQGADRGAVDRATSEIFSLTEALELRERRLAEEAQRAQALKSLADNAVEARVEVTQERFQAVQPVVANIFSRLDPHPTFKTIEFELDTYYRRGTTSAVVTDLVEGVSADPLVIFSTSQANIAALSYFLAMGLSAGERNLPFVLLDDPVQSMDDINVLGFADLCRHLRTDRQLIISTHERRFARLLERKLAPRAENESTEIIQFVGWDRSGPAVEQRTVEPQLIGTPLQVVGVAS